MPKTKKSVLALFFFFSLAMFPSCQIDEYTPEKTVINQINPEQTHIEFNQKQIAENTKLAEQIFDTLLVPLPQSEEINQLINQHQDWFIPTYHFIYTSQPDHQFTYTFAVLSKQDLSREIDNLPVPDNYYVKYEHPFLIFNTTLNSPSINHQTKKESFLIIHSLEASFLFSNTENKSNLANLAINNFLSKLSTDTPIELYYQNNQIIINSPPKKSSSPPLLNYIVQLNSPENIDLRNKICDILVTNYLDCNDMQIKNTNQAIITDNQGLYTISLEYTEQEKSQKIFDLIKTSLDWQKNYAIEDKSLPDGSTTNLVLPQTSNIEIETDQNNINYQNINQEKINISISNQLLTISNDPSLPEPHLNTISIPWLELSSQINQLEKINIIDKVVMPYNEEGINGSIVLINI